MRMALSPARRKLLLRLLAFVLLLYAACASFIWWSMRQPPETFGRVMSKMPGPVPFLLYDARKPLRGGGKLPYDERAVADARTVLPEGYRLIEELFAD
mgnify:CR=1 FL=1